MYCQKCGTRNEQDAAYCTNCGQSVKSKALPRWMLPVVFSCLIVLAGSVAGIGYMTGWEFSSQLHKEASDSAEPPHQPVPQTQTLTAPPSADTNVSAPAGQKEQKKEKTEVIKESLPKVFTIFTQDGLGSGFLYKKGGLIVTNAHVVAGYTDVVVRNSEGQDAAGQVIGISDKYDVALIRSGANSAIEPLTSEYDETPIGTEVIALGSPQGFENSASVGYLTGLNRDMELGFTYEKIYQIDAQIDKGSSGGPLLDAKSGKVIGINSLLYNNNNTFGFSIPIHSMLGLLDQWAAAPMSASQVASLFGVYDSYSVPADYDSDIAYDDEYTDFYRDVEEYSPEEGSGDDSSYLLDELYEFMSAFRSDYEDALVYAEGFQPISHYFLPGAASTAAFRTFVDEVAVDDRIYEFYTSDILDIELQEDHAAVTMFLSYSVADSKGEQNFFEKHKVYTIVSDDTGTYRISNVADL